MEHRNGRGAAHKQSRKFTTRFWIVLTSMVVMLFMGKSIIGNQPDWGEQRALAQVGRTGPGAVEVLAGTGLTIPFSEQKRQANGDRPAEMKSIPHLVLFRNGELTGAAERTLFITINDLPVSPGGLALNVLLETQDGDPDRDGEVSSRIVAWQAERRIEFSPPAGQPAGEAAFEVEFSESISYNGEIIPTPTGYYRLVVSAAQADASELLFTASQEYAFLLERQWIAPLESSEGPRELVVYYCDMVPFQRVNGEAASRLPRAAVPDYVQAELIPRMVAAVDLQTKVWGFSWEGWVSFSGDRSNHRLEVTLSDGETWYHGRAPERGLSTIAINVNGGDNAEYETLADGLMSTFHHELFHNFQRAIGLSGGKAGTLAGKDAAWQFFSEGMASFVPTVAQQQVQFSQSRQARAYLAKAVEYVGGKGFAGELNDSYAELNPYNGALYWRFLYEQCSGMADGGENPAVGMGVIRETLRVLYSGEIVDIRNSTDLVGFTPAIMDHVLSSPQAVGCPFRTYTDSLAHFARAIYRLRLEGGRCSAPGIPAGCGFYDPNNLYSQPSVQTYSYSGTELGISAEDQPHPAGIRSSFGMDFIEIALGAGTEGQSLTVAFDPDATGEAEFLVQVIPLRTQAGGGFSPQKVFQVSTPEWISPGAAPGSLTIPAVDLAAYDRLGLVITRVDARERLDPVGDYRLVVRPGG